MAYSFDQLFLIYLALRRLIILLIGNTDIFQLTKNRIGAFNLKSLVHGSLYISENLV